MTRAPFVDSQRPKVNHLLRLSVETAGAPIQRSVTTETTSTETAALLIAECRTCSLASVKTTLAAALVVEARMMAAEAREAKTQALRSSSLVGAVGHH